MSVSKECRSGARAVSTVHNFMHSCPFLLSLTHVTNQPPFSPIRSGPKAASRPSRQKQFPAMRLVKSGCDFFCVWFRLGRFGGSSLMVVSAVFNEGPSSHWECRRASDQHSLLSARLLVRKAPGDLFESRKERAVSSSNRAFFSERPRNFSDARHS